MVIREHTWMNRLTCVIALFFLGVALATGALSAGAAKGPVLAPQLLARVNGSSTVYVLSTSADFESDNPAACNYQACFHLQRTNDNGAHFTTGHLPSITFANGSLLGNLSQVIFATMDDGYILLGGSPVATLKVTVDGAKTWHSESIAPDVSILDFTTTHSELYAVIAHCPKSGECTNYRIARSPLSANRWSFTKLAKWPSGMGVGMGAYGSSVWLTQQTHATVVVFSSHNRGRTFTRSSAPKLGSVYACSITAMSTTALWAECPTGMSVSFFYSGDGGVHWNVLPVVQFAGTGGGAFDPVSSTVGYLAYGPSDTPGAKNLYRITNDGRTMTPVGRLACNIVNGLVFTDTMHGLAACDRGNTQATTYLLQTFDGGATWKKVGLN
jgi:hypothetical protein